MIEIIETETQIKTQWRDSQLHITWHKDGEVLAGIVLSEDQARLLGVVIRLALTEKETQ